MLGLFRRRTDFGLALRAWGLDRCSLSGKDLWVGLPPEQDHRRIPLKVVPQAPLSVLFVEGPEQRDLIAALVASPAAGSVENLMIGTSHRYIGPERPTPYDFSDAVAALKGAKLPALKRLVLGDMELLFNGHGYYGHLGDITHVFDAAPALEELRICGRAELAHPVRHLSLKAFLLYADDIAGNSGALPQSSLTNILLSRFPKLTELHLSLETDNAPDYRIPPRFFVDRSARALASLSIDCLAPEDHAKLIAWKAARKLPG